MVLYMNIIHVTLYMYSLNLGRPFEDIHILENSLKVDCFYNFTKSIIYYRVLH